MLKRAGLLLLVASCACTGDERDPERVDATPCERLRDHLIDLRLANLENVDLEAHRAALQHALGSDFLAACQKTMAPEEISCAIDATDAASAQRCTPRDRQGGAK